MRGMVLSEVCCAGFSTLWGGFTKGRPPVKNKSVSIILVYDIRNPQKILSTAEFFDIMHGITGITDN
jgi:hypothetical protein